MNTWETNVSPNFKLKEFYSAYDKKQLTPDVAYWMVNPDIIEIMEYIHTHYRVPIMITSGYRSPDYNKSIGGSKNSMHSIWRACDFIVKDIPSDEVRKWIKETRPYSKSLYKITGLEEFPGMSWVHIDSRHSAGLMVFGK